MASDRGDDDVDDSARQLATLLANLPGMAYRCRADARWTLEFVSDGCEALTGYRADELLAPDVREFAFMIVPMDRHAVEVAVKEAVEAGRAFTIEYRLRDRAGRIRHVWERGRVVGGAGEDAVLEGFITDISESKRTEHELRERVKELRFLYELTSIVSSDMPIAEAMWAIVERAPAAYCYPPEVAARITLDGQSYASPNFYASGCRQSAPIVVCGRTAGEVEVCRVTTEPGLPEAYFLREEQEMLTAVAERLGVFAERERMTEALRASERRARDLYERMPVATVCAQRADGDFMLVDHNEAAHALTGGLVQRWIGRSLRALIPDRRDVLGDLERCLDERVAIRRELEHTTASGRVYVLTVSIGYVSRDLAIVHVTDVTHERRLEERFHQAQKMEVLGRLAAGVAHDFNNLLTVVLSYSDMLLRGPDLNDPARGDVLEIRKAGERAAAMTRQLLTFSRRQVVQPRTADLNQLILDVEGMLRQLLGEERELVTALASGLWTVRVDTSQFDQVLFNLVVNARDATQPGGRVTVETQNVELDEAYARQLVGVSPGHYVMLVVSDTGVGMDAATRARLFEPFFTTKPPGMGTGMGLATVYGIVRQSGGHIHVYSEPGRGTTFRVYFPRTGEEPPASRPGGTPQLHRATGGETVLVVEDAEPVRRLVQRVLGSAGYDVRTAANGAEARLLFERHRERIDLLLTDIVMPWTSGPDLAAQVAQRSPGVRVLFMSGYAERAAQAVGELTAGVNFIAKPFTAEMLTRMVRELLDGQRGDGPPR